jgi:pimeloyl-ACP methyl ester carboxylesterase
MQASRFFVTVVLSFVAATGIAQDIPGVSRPVPNQNCARITWENARGSAGEPNVNHDGTPLPGREAPDVSQGFGGIPRSEQPPLTPTQERILECSYHLSEANADLPYTLFVPTTYDASVPMPLVVDLHGLAITPLQQILFDGTTDLAERLGFIVLAPMGYSVTDSWGAARGGGFGRGGAPVETASIKPGTNERYSSAELAELDAMTVLALIREHYTIDDDRIYLMGHSMGGMGTYYLGAKYQDIWAALAPISGLGGISDVEAAESYQSIPMLLMHGDRDSIVPPETSRRAAMLLQAVGAQHIYLEIPGADHEFWIRRGAENMEKVFLFFEILSRRTNVGFITPDMAPLPAARGGPPPGPGRGGLPPGAGRGGPVPTDR